MEVGTFHVSKEALLAAAQSGLREGRQSPEGILKEIKKEAGRKLFPRWTMGHFECPAKELRLSPLALKNLWRCLSRRVTWGEVKVGRL